MKEIELIIPDSIEYSKEFDEFESKVVELAGGYSFYEGKGVWVDAKGHRLEERHERWLIAASYEKLNKIALLFIEVMKTTEEEAIYMKIDGEVKILCVTEKEIQMEQDFLI